MSAPNPAVDPPCLARSPALQRRRIVKCVVSLFTVNGIVSYPASPVSSTPFSIGEWGSMGIGDQEPYGFH